ncbi:MAG: hypothetical protein ACREKN_01175 [Longimicrobiaceae bacterium]
MTEPSPRYLHLKHVQELLKLVHLSRAEGADRERYGTSPTLYIADEDPTGQHFRELIGYRISGFDSLNLGTVSFRRSASGDGDSYPRRSLANYLSQPPKQIGFGETLAPPGAIEVHLPPLDEEIPAFLQKVRTGGKSRGLVLDTGIVECAFDFRSQNPSPDRNLALNRKPLFEHVIRTVSGHVLSGYSVGIRSQLLREVPFVMLTSAVQHGPKGEALLPALALNRTFICAETEIHSPDTVAEWTRETRLFSAAAANPRHLFGG